jgi:hypothetical protein
MKIRRRNSGGLQLAIEASEEVRTASGNNETKTFRFDAIVQTPTIQMNF